MIGFVLFTVVAILWGVTFGACLSAASWPWKDIVILVVLGVPIAVVLWRAVFMALTNDQ